jgi:hypothetical protein
MVNVPECQVFFLVRLECILIIIIISNDKGRRKVPHSNCLLKSESKPDMGGTRDDDDANLYLLLVAQSKAHIIDIMQIRPLYFLDSCKKTVGQEKKRVEICFRLFFSSSVPHRRITSFLLEGIQVMRTLNPQSATS